MRVNAMADNHCTPEDNPCCIIDPIDCITDVSITRPFTLDLASVVATQDYLSWQPCSVNAVVIQPSSNSSTFTRINAKVYDLPHVACDDRYPGNCVIRRPRYIMTTPWYVPPLNYCGTGSLPDCGGFNSSNYPWQEDVDKSFLTDSTLQLYTTNDLCKEDYEVTSDTGCLLQILSNALMGRG